MIFEHDEMIHHEMRSKYVVTLKELQNAYAREIKNNQNPPLFVKNNINCFDDYLAYALKHDHYIKDE